MATRKPNNARPLTDMTFDIEMIDRIKAEEILAHNHDRNRRISQPAILKLARDMLEGRYQLSPQTASIGSSGNLIDGQHRLKAIIAADAVRPGITVPLLVARNVPEAVFDIIDHGQPRNAGQALAGHGFVNVNILAAAARLVMRYEMFPDRLWSMHADISKAMVVEFVLANADEALSLTVDHLGLRRARLNTSTMTGLQWLVVRHSGFAEKWDDFVTGLLVGADLKVGDPRLTLRNRDEGRQKDQWGGGQGRLGVYLKCWNGYVEGRSVKILRFGKENLPMPKVA